MKSMCEGEESVITANFPALITTMEKRETFSKFSQSYFAIKIFKKNNTYL